MTVSSRWLAALMAMLAIACDPPTASTTPSATVAATAVATAPAADAWATQEEFEKAPDTTIPGGKEAGCVARVVRRHVRFICSARDGHPAPDTIVNQRSNVVLASGAKNGVAHVQTEFSAGLDLAATFVWGDKARELTARWPKGAPMPTSYGSFSAEVPFVNPCKAQGLEGYGSSFAPCLYKEPAPLAVTWTNELGPTDAKPEQQAPVLEVENRGTRTVDVLTVTLSFFDEAGKRIERDNAGKDPSASTYSTTQKFAPKSKTKITLGPLRPDIPDAVKFIEVHLIRFETSDPSVTFAPQKVEEKVEKVEKADKKDERKRKN